MQCPFVGGTGERLLAWHYPDQVRTVEDYGVFLSARWYRAPVWLNYGTFAIGCSVTILAMASFLVALLIGSIAGTLSGLFGIGGGIVIVPMLISFLKFNSSKAVGTSLAAMLLPVGIMAVLRYAHNGDVNFRIAGGIAIGIFVMALVGAKIGLSVGNVWVLRAFGGLLVAVGLKFIITSH